MRKVLVAQMDELVAALRSAAGGTSTGESAGYVFASPAVEGERCLLADRAMNAVRTSGPVEFALPGPSEGRGRDLVVKIHADAEVVPRFTGARFEGDDADVFAPVAAGGTVLMCLTETEPGVMLAARKTLFEINQ